MVRGLAFREISCAVFLAEECTSRIDPGVGCQGCLRRHNMKVERETT